MTVTYVAEITNVQEVTLVGAADLAFWKDQLGRANLDPAEKEGKAELLISAMNSKFRGIRFRELIIAVTVHRQTGPEQYGVYLAQAFNSSRLFAFLERKCFSTPYHHGEIHVDVRVPASIALVSGNEIVFRAAMGAEMPPSRRSSARSADADWKGPVFLPKTACGTSDSGKLFFAKIAGHTQTYPFDFSMDQLTIKPIKDHPVLQWLIDSNFTAKEWNIRENAVHGKSKTMARNIAGTANSD